MKVIARNSILALLFWGAMAGGAKGDETATAPAKPHKLGPLFSHELLDRTLQKHVKDGRLNYAAVKQDKDLDRFIDLLADAQPETFLSDDQRMAFWINVFNACVIKGVADHYPVNSVRSLPGFWTTKRYNVAGGSYSLKEIESLIKKQFPDPRVACTLCRGSLDGPKVPDRAYNTWDISDRLENAASEFVNAKPRQNVLIDKIGGKVTLSKLFNWWGDVIAKKGRLDDFLFRYLESKVNAKFIIHEHYTIDYFEWNWKLNDTGSEG